MTTKQQRRNNGVQNVVAAQKRSNAKTPATPVVPVVPAATEQEQPLVVQLDVSPVNATPAEPAVPAEPEQTPAAEPEQPAAAAPAEAEQTPAAEPEQPAAAAPAGFTNQQEMEFILQGIKTLLGIKEDVPLTTDGLMALGLRTVRQTLMGVLANEEAMAGIKEKREELISKAKALVPQTSPAAAAEPAQAEVRQEPRVLAVGSLARWLPSGHMAKRLHLHPEDKEVGVVGELDDYRWYKIGGELVWDYK